MTDGDTPSQIKMTRPSVNIFIASAARVHMLNADVKITAGRSFSNSQRMDGESHVNPSLSPVEVIFSLTYLKPRKYRTANLPSYSGRNPPQLPVKMTIFGK